jgi:hypothetical protein
VSSLIFAIVAYATLIAMAGWVGVAVAAAHAGLLLAGAHPPWQWKRYRPDPSRDAGGSGGGTEPPGKPETRMEP